MLHGGVSQFVLTCPVLSPFFLFCLFLGPRTGTNEDKRGQTGTKRDISGQIGKRPHLGSTPTSIDIKRHKASQIVIKGQKHFATVNDNLKIACLTCKEGCQLRAFLGPHFLHAAAPSSIAAACGAHSQGLADLGDTPPHLLDSPEESQ